MCISSITLAELIHGVERIQSLKETAETLKPLPYGWKFRRTMILQQPTMAE